MEYLYKQIVVNRYLSGEGDVWVDNPTRNGIVLYSFIVPVISLFGVLGNIVCFMVLRQKELANSVYTYLAVLAASDILNGVYLFFSGLSRGILWEYGWNVYDALIGLPIGGFLSSLSILATVAVTIDRVICIWNPLCFRKRFCNRILARKIMLICILISIAFNIPYCFIFEINDRNWLVTTSFFDSTYYNVHNWIKLSLFGIISGLILVGGNIFLIITFKKVSSVRSKEFMVCRKQKCQDNMKLNLTLIMVIIVFLISGIPAQLISRNTAIGILFNGNHDKINSKSLEVIRQICTLLGVICLSVNFILYYLFFPTFSRTMTKMFKKRKKMRRQSNLQVNVYLLNVPQEKNQRAYFIETNHLKSTNFSLGNKGKHTSTTNTEKCP